MLDRVFDVRGLVVLFKRVAGLAGGASAGVVTSAVADADVLACADELFAAPGAAGLLLEHPEAKRAAAITAATRIPWGHEAS